MTLTIRDAVAAVRQRVDEDPARAVVRLRTEGRMGEGTRVDMRVGAFDFGVDEASVSMTGLPSSSRSPKTRATT
jgi:hypothetical protein